MAFFPVWLECFCWALSPETGALQWLGVFLPSEADETGGFSLQEYCSRGIASLGRSGADREAAHVILTAAALSVACLIGLNCLPSPHQISSNVQTWKGWRQRGSAFCRGRQYSKGVGNCIVISEELLWFFSPQPYPHMVSPGEGWHSRAKHSFCLSDYWEGGQFLYGDTGWTEAEKNVPS